MPVSGPPSVSATVELHRRLDVNNFCYATCGAATIGVGGPSSYTGGATSSNRGGTATWGVGDVNSYTGGATGGTTDNGTNATDRTDNYGPGHS